MAHINITIVIFAAEMLAFARPRYDNYRCIVAFILISIQIQWNLSIADMLYSGHLSIADNISKNGWNHGHSLIEKPFYSGQK